MWPGAFVFNMPRMVNWHWSSSNKLLLEVMGTCKLFLCECLARNDKEMAKPRYVHALLIFFLSGEAFFCSARFYETPLRIFSEYLLTSRLPSGFLGEPTRKWWALQDG
jgi:hypothetical protein